MTSDKKFSELQNISVHIHILVESIENEVLNWDKLAPNMQKKYQIFRKVLKMLKVLKI